MAALEAKQAAKPSDCCSSLWFNICMFQTQLEQFPVVFGWEVKPFPALAGFGPGVTKTAKTWCFPDPNQVVFVPKPNQTSTALWKEKHLNPKMFRVYNIKKCVFLYLIMSVMIDYISLWLVDLNKIITVYIAVRFFSSYVSMLAC